MRSFASFVSLSLAAFLLLLCAAQPKPVVAGSSAKDRGAELFSTRGCAHCHGPAGVGGNIGPDLQEVRKRLTAAQMTTQIHDGGKGMPPYGDQLTSAEIDDLVSYLRARRGHLAPPPAPPPQPGPSS